MSSDSFSSSEGVRSSSMFKKPSEVSQIPSEDCLDQSSKDDEQLGSDNGAAASFCDFLAAHSDRITNGAGRCWEDMSLRQRARFAKDSAEVNFRSMDFLQHFTKDNKQGEQPKTPVPAEAIFGADCGDQLFSNFLKEFQLMYGDVFTSKEILDAAKRRWNTMTTCERSLYERGDHCKLKKACPKPRRMACPRRPRCPKPRSAKKKCAKPRAARRCPKPKSVKRCSPKPRSVKKHCLKPRSVKKSCPQPRSVKKSCPGSRSVKCCPRPWSTHNEFGTKLELPKPHSKEQASKTQEVSTLPLSTFGLTGLGGSCRKVTAFLSGLRPF